MFVNVIIGDFQFLALDGCETQWALCLFRVLVFFAKSPQSAPAWQRLSAEELTDNFPPARFRLVMGRVGGVIEAGCERDEAQIFLQQRIAEIAVNRSRQFWVAALEGPEVQFIPHGEIVDRIVVPEQ
jgi:hypothetical protein